MKNYIVLFMASAFLVTGCKDKYQEGFNAGKTKGAADGESQGYSEGYDAGYTSTYQGAYDTSYAEGRTQGHGEGYAEGKAYYTSNDNYGAGFNDGWSQGYARGDDQGYADGYEESYDPNYTAGYDDHVNEGYMDGYDDGHDNGRVAGASDGYNDGYDDASAISYYDGYDDGFADGESSGYYEGKEDGYADGATEGYNDGYDDGSYYAYQDGYDYGYGIGETDGYNDGYDAGWDDGYDAAIGSSVKTTNPSVKLAAMVNGDLIDYSKLQKFDSKTAASMAMNHADNGTVDMEKLASFKEQHYLNQMSQQLKARFALSADRAKDIAVVAHQFNKLAGTRELTEKDANVFAVEVIGKNLKDVEVAVSKSLKGESDDLKTMLNDIAKHNKTTPENVNKIIGEVFFQIDLKQNLKRGDNMSPFFMRSRPGEWF